MCFCDYISFVKYNLLYEIKNNVNLTNIFNEDKLK